MRVVLIGYLFLAALYAAAIPRGKGPDETAHLRYIEFLAQEHRLPVFDRERPGADYEFHQPPVYYLICLPTYLLAGRGREATQQALRFLTLLLSVPLLYLTFALGRMLVPAEPWAALGAAGVVAFLPMHLGVVSSLSNDALTEVFFAAALCLLVLHLRAAALYRAGESQTPPKPAIMVAVGVAMGLGLLTKSIAALLFPAAWLAAALAARGPRGYDWGRLMRDVCLSTGVALVIAGWWLARNRVLYGDPLAQHAFLSAFRDRPSPQEFMARYQASLPEYVGQVMIWTAASVLGVFGPVHGNRFVFFPYWVYMAPGLIAVAGVVGFARHLARVTFSGWQRQAWWVCAALGGLLLASFVRFNFSFFQAQARYLFPALPPGALALSLGLQEISPARWRKAASLAAPVALALLALVGLPLWLLPQFRFP